MKKYDFRSHIVDEFDEDIDIGVNYSVFGKHYPATLEQPEEFPELEILEVDDLLTGLSIMDKLSDYQYDRLTDRCWEHYDEYTHYGD